MSECCTGRVREEIWITEGANKPIAHITRLLRLDEGGQAGEPGDGLSMEALTRARHVLLCALP